MVFRLETLVFEPVARMARTLEELPERTAWGDWKALDVPPRSDHAPGRFEAFLDQAIDAVGSLVTDVRLARPGPSIGAATGRTREPPAGADPAARVPLTGSSTPAEAGSALPGLPRLTAPLRGAPVSPQPA